MANYCGINNIIHKVFIWIDHTTSLKGWMVVKMWTLLFWIFLKRLKLCHINACCASYDYMVSRGVHSNGFLAFYRVAPKVCWSTMCALIPVIVPRGWHCLWCAPRHCDRTPIVFAVYKWLSSVLNPTTSCRLFADDCLIYRTINSISDQVVLQNDLKALHDWGTIWGLNSMLQSVIWCTCPGK